MIHGIQTNDVCSASVKHSHFVAAALWMDADYLFYSLNYTLSPCCSRVAAGSRAAQITRSLHHLNIALFIINLK